MIKLLNKSEIDKYKEEISKIYGTVFELNEEIQKFLIYRIDESLNNNLNTKIWVAIEDDKLVGFLFGFDFKKENWWAEQVKEYLPKTENNWYENTFELNELAVLKEYRNKGYGKELMLGLIKDNSYKKILLSTYSEDNDKVINFYKALGFTVLVDKFNYKNKEYKESKIMCYRKKLNK